ncbi:MAG: hypothetical protein M3335_03365 [Actinomycetota bacterium]|nr:hypothetical protein [Actinomycetota bacterium]
MGDLVDARLPRPFGMPLAHCDQDQGWDFTLFVTGENRSPSAVGSRDVELDAAAETGSVLPFLFASQQPLERHSFFTQRRNHRLDCCSSRWSGVTEVLSKNLINDANFKARTRARACQ